MSLRFSSNLAHLVLGGAVLVACFAFAESVLAWIALGAGATVVVVSLTGFAMTARGGAQRALDVVMALAGGWLIVASRVLGLAALKWNTFGVAALVAGLAALGLVLNERRRSAAVHRLMAERPPLQPTLFESRWRAREAGYEPHPITGAMRAEAPAR